ncbi:MAG: hypothetical protein IPM46_14405 [Flavobacteriales bacterium]|nr:hypothetical protein [Flavobacteriales bacterium]
MRSIRSRGLAVLGALCLVHALSAQNESDALRIATQRPGGTARSLGMGNAFGALGADPVALSINPAGFGLYRASSLSISASLDFNADQAMHYGTTSKDLQQRFALSNAALVLQRESDKEGRSSVFGVVYDRVQSHHNSTNILGNTVPSTILQAFAEEAFGTPYSRILDDLPFTAGLAWDAYGLDTLTGTVDQYIPFIPFGSSTQQRRSIEAHGATTRTGLFYAGNLDDRVYLGGALNIMGHRFNRTLSHTENSLDGTLDLGTVNYKEKLATSGNGFELSLGAIFRVNDRVRLGAAFFSPQWWQLNDSYVHQMSTTFRSPDTEGNYAYESISPDGTFSYRLHTPWRATASAAYIAGQHGLVSLDYEYADLRSMRFRAANNLEDLYDFELENQAIQRRFIATHSVRVGTEWRLENWYLRGGFGFVPDPFRTNDLESGQALRSFALGVGYRSAHLTVDLGLERWLQGLQTYLYDPALVESTVIDRSGFRSMITVALRP